MKIVNSIKAVSLLFLSIAAAYLVAGLFIGRGFMINQAIEERWQDKTKPIYDKHGNHVDDELISNGWKTRITLWRKAHLKVPAINWRKKEAAAA